MIWTVWQKSMREGIADTEAIPFHTKKPENYLEKQSIHEGETNRSF